MIVWPSNDCQVTVLEIFAILAETLKKSLSAVRRCLSVRPTIVNVSIIFLSNFAYASLRVFILLHLILYIVQQQLHRCDRGKGYEQCEFKPSKN